MVHLNKEEKDGHQTGPIVVSLKQNGLGVFGTKAHSLRPLRIMQSSLRSVASPHELALPYAL